jgi:NAD(P)-dependent dehydrogenase (short-subunit alcohol dehydrogenase family)
VKGRVAVVTGGGRGIGRAIALRFAAEGADVVISSRTQDDLDAVAAQGEGRIHPVVADALDPDGARLPVREAVDRHGHVDVLVNNVGGHQRTFEDTLTLNLLSAWWTTEEALPHMRRHGWGRIINIGSGASRRASASPGYTAAKHGLVGLTRQLAVDTGTQGITVNCLCPGWTNTSLLDWDRVAATKGVTTEEARGAAEADSAQRRILEPEELTGLAVLLASEGGAGITGQVLAVDGGYKL